MTSDTGHGLTAVNVTFGYDKSCPVIRNVSASVPRGSIVGILGPNGSGKTTLLRLLSGLATPWSGQVSLDGADLRSIPRAAMARRMAVVPQETQLAFDYSVLEMAMMGRYPHLKTFEVEGPSDIAIAREALALTGTLQLEDRPFRTLSGGEKQRVVIAAALTQFSSHGLKTAEQTDVLLLDEPTASLDLAYQLEIRAILTELNRTSGLTIVVSTHDLNMAAAFCGELILLESGRVLAAGPLASTLTRARVEQLYGV
jgi:iron complex transport system ATP-binding protein